MVAAVSTWIKDIILVVLFASFMELLLPNSSMQRFIRVIIGLFIMLTILNPVLDVVQNRLTPEQELSTVATSVNTDSIENVSKPIKNERDRISYEIYKKELAKQIRALVIAIEGVSDAKVAVEVNSGENGSQAGTIKSIIVYVHPGITSRASSISQIPKVSISKTDSVVEAEALKPQLVSKIQHSIAALYQLSQNQIEVKLLY